MRDLSALACYLLGNSRGGARRGERGSLLYKCGGWFWSEEKANGNEKYGKIYINEISCYSAYFSNFFCVCGEDGCIVR